MKDSESEVKVQVRNINKQLWLILFSATTPFLLLAIAGVITAESSEEKLLKVSTFIFAFGLALIATKVASHTAVGRHLKNIEEINEMKSDFIAVASHQLKTPISAFIYSLDGLESAYKKDDHETFMMFLHDIKGSARRLSLLTKNLLNVTLINNEASTAVLEPFAIRSRIEEMITQLEPVRELQKVELETILSVTPETTVCCDSGLFYHVLENLISNAYKYSEKDLPVTLKATESTNSVKISISNKASSLKQNDIDTLFKKYKRATTTKTTRSDGFGLGLYITKKFVESWGGSITAQLNERTSEITFSFTVLKSDAREFPRLLQKTS